MPKTRIDLDRFRVPETGLPTTLPFKVDPPQLSKLPRPHPGEAFLGAKIPMSWIERATCLPGKTWPVAVALWFVGGRSSSAEVTLTAKTLKRFALTRKVVYRALGHLERAGLVKVRHRNGRKPLVTILPVPASER
jgi:hypothetical protein